MLELTRHRALFILNLAAVLMLSAACAQPPAEEAEMAGTEMQKIPVTTSSDQARDLFIAGRDLNERLRATDSHDYFVQAIEQDPDFAWAHLLAGFTGSTAQEFWDHLEHAVAAADGASDGERHLILATEAGAKGRPDEQMQHLNDLVAAYPGDQRAHNALGAAHFGRQEYDEAIAHYEHAIEIDPDFSQPYNQKGYAHRFLGDYEAAEASFQKYVELIPHDPNPYDSYAELLMKMGRFEESIEKYREALKQNQNFVASYIGIANNQVFMGDGDAARVTLDELVAVARNTGERRAAHLWTARTHLHEGNHGAALVQCREMYAIAEAESDWAAASGDLNLMGDILLEAGQYDEAAENYAKSIETIEMAEVSDDVKANVKRNVLFDEGRLALARGDVEGAATTAASYTEMTGAKQIPFEMRQAHELEGMVALAQGGHAEAAAHLGQANQQNPRVLFLLAQAHQGQDNTDEAREYCDKAANYNALSSTYGYVRSAAREMLAGM